MEYLHVTCITEYVDCFDADSWQCIYLNSRRSGSDLGTWPSQRNTPSKRLWCGVTVDDRTKHIQIIHIRTTNHAALGVGWSPCYWKIHFKSNKNQIATDLGTVDFIKQLWSIPMSLLGILGCHNNDILDFLVKTLELEIIKLLSFISLIVFSFIHSNKFNMNYSEIQNRYNFKMFNSLFLYSYGICCRGIQQIIILYSKNYYKK